MGFRFRRSVRLFQGPELNSSRSGVSGSIDPRGAWLTLGRRGARAAVGVPAAGISYSEESPWARPKPHVQPSVRVPGAPGIEVAELPREDIDIPPAPVVAPARARRDDGAESTDPRLVVVSLAIAGIVALAAILWAALIA
jgi:preprotein translocase subunit Sec61beta